MIIVGFDLSLRSTGLARLEGDLMVDAGTLKTGTRKGHPRLAFMEENLLAYAKGADLLVVEGISMGSFDAYKRSGGMWWIMTHMLWKAGIPVAVVPPSNRAKYATGNGSAPKSLVIECVNNHLIFPHAIPSDDNDICDAQVLVHMASRHIGHPIDNVPLDQQLQTLRGDWPD